MNEVKRTNRKERAPRSGAFAELERLARRAAALPLAAPILLLSGLGLGRLTTHLMAPPPDAPARIAPAPLTPHLEALGNRIEGVGRIAERAEALARHYRDTVLPVEESLRRRGVPDTTARQVAGALVKHSHRQGLDPATVLSILLIESGGEPRATGPVGSRGLMQVMPLWAGRWRECGKDLYDIDNNLCTGTRVLAWNLKRHGGDERRALLGYNGCVNGTNTPNCTRYADQVVRIRRQLQAEWGAGRRGQQSAD